MFLLQPSFDLSRDKTSPERNATSPKTSPGEEPTVDQKSLPPPEPVIQEEEEEEEVTADRKNPPASAKAGTEAADPASQGPDTILAVTASSSQS